MSVLDSDRGRDAVFVVGAFGSMLAAAFGVAVLVLAMSVGVRESQQYLTGGEQTALTVAGAALVVLGGAAYLYRADLPRVSARTAGRSARIAAGIGVALVLFGASVHTTVSAPFLADPGQKILLFGIAYALVGAGYVGLRTTARFVGWSV